MINANKLTIEALQKRGCHVDIVERYDARCRRRFDLFGFLDIVAIDLTSLQILGIQATSGTNLAARRKKITTGDARQIAIDWLRTGNALQLWGWRQLSGHDRLTPRIEHLKISDFSD